MKPILASELDDIFDDEDIIEIENNNNICNTYYNDKLVVRSSGNNNNRLNMSFCLIDPNRDNHKCYLLYTLVSPKEKMLIPDSLYPDLINRILITDKTTGEVLFDKRFNEYKIIKKSDAGEYGNYKDDLVYQINTFTKNNSNEEPFSYSYVSYILLDNNLNIPIELEVHY